MELDGRTALITGAGGGIATATALALAERGVSIVAGDRELEAVESTVAAVRSAGGTALAVEADVSSAGQVAAMVGAGVDHFGGIDICINAVGIGGVAMVVDHPDDLWHQVLAVNLTSAFLVCRSVLPSMIERGGGRIVNITSRSAYRSGAGTSAYAASKGGLLAFSRVLAAEAGPHGITVNNVAPGTTLTPLVTNYYTTEEARAAEAESSGVLLEPRRLTEPDEIAAAVVYLCGPGSEHTTGSTIHVNGGSYCP